MLKRTKIVATLGPSTHEEQIISDIINAGVDVVRLNFSHGSYDDHALLIERVRTAAATIKKPVAILQDLQGPKIRLGALPNDGVTVNDGDTIVFDTSIKEYTDEAFPVDFSELHRYVKAGERLLINDGRVQTKITAVDDTKISAAVVHGGLLSSHKGINVPDSAVTVSAMTEKDKADAQFGVEHEVDFIALSFVKTAADISELRALIPSHIKIIAKMERPEAIKNAAEILAAADGIMVARGDLGIEIDAARVPVVQKELVEAARLAGKPVIVATQMLDSMQTNPAPTRAEVGDVANAVIDHADAVMLSNETATGQFPLAAVTAMADIIRTTEASKYDDVLQVHPEIVDGPASDVLSEVTRLASEEVAAAAIVTVSIDGGIARHISRCRPQVPIITVTKDGRTARCLALVSGVYAIPGNPQTPEEAIEAAIQFAKDLGCVLDSHSILVALGEPFTTAEKISVLQIKAV